jgi:hypothetical protein
MFLVVVVDQLALESLSSHETVASGKKLGLAKKSAWQSLAAENTGQPQTTSLKSHPIKRR